LIGLREKDRVLGVQGQEAGGAQDGRVQPPHPEQKKKDANDQLQKMKRHLLQERSEQTDQPEGQPPCRARPAASRARWRQRA
jgi:hypothetical protein